MYKAIVSSFDGKTSFLSLKLLHRGICIVQTLDDVICINQKQKSFQMSKKEKKGFYSERAGMEKQSEKNPKQTLPHFIQDYMYQNIPILQSNQ